MATRKSVDQILDKAADIIEKDGWVAGSCYDSETGGRCALGAIAQAVYPKASPLHLEDLAYVNEYSEYDYVRVNGKKKDSRHVEAVRHLASCISRRKFREVEADEIVHVYNDYGRRTSSVQVAKKLRSAADKYRQTANS